jgi:hypothetical protein
LVAAPPSGNIREHDVIIRILGDFAIIHARTSYQKTEGTQGTGATPMIGSFATGAGNALRPTLRASGPKRRLVAARQLSAQDNRRS